MNTEPIPDDCLPFNGDEQKLIEFLRGPRIGADGKIEGDGHWTGKTPEQILAERDAYNRACGE